GPTHGGYRVSSQKLPIRFIARGVAHAGVREGGQPRIEPRGQHGHDVLPERFGAFGLLLGPAHGRYDGGGPLSASGRGELGLELQAVASPSVGSPDHTSSAEAVGERAGTG